MGSSESTLLNSQTSDDGITTVSERLQDVDPILDKLHSLQIASPILTASASSSSSSSSSASTENSLTDILIKKPSTSSSSNTGMLDPKVILELFSTYQELQEKQAQNINKRQEEIENKIELADALALKLLQRYNYSASAMKTTSTDLTGVDELQVELGELKGRLTEVMSNCDALCKRIAAGGPEPLRSSVKPFVAVAADLKASTSHCSVLNGAPLQLKPET